MNSMTQTLRFQWKVCCVTFGIAMLLAIPCLARQRVPVEKALNASLKEREVVQRNYKSNLSRRQQPTDRRAVGDERRIKLEMGDELDSGGGGGADVGSRAPSRSADDVMAFRSHLPDEDLNANINPDAELTEIDRSVPKDLSRGLDSITSDEEAEILPETLPELAEQSPKI